MMGYGVNNLGMFQHWSKLADYTTAKRAQLSDELPVPNGKKIVLSTNASAYSGNVNQLLFVDGNNHNPELTALVNKYYEAGTDKTKRLAAIVDILKYIDSNDSFSVTSDVIENPYFRHLINLLNKHNLGTISEEAAKNLAASRIQKVCSDVRNIQSAHTPIDRATSKLTRELNKMPGREGGSVYDGKAIYQLQEDNLTGRAVVGVMANALKAFLNMSQYFNQYYRNTDNVLPENTPFFFNRFTLNGKTYNLANLANIVMSDEQAEQIATFASNLSGLNEELLHTKDDVSIILSAFTTLATDNAKMLALAKLRASLNLASMHCYLAMFGVPFKDIVEYTTSTLFTDLYELTKANGYTNSDGNVNEGVWIALTQNAQNGRGYTVEEVNQLHRLYNLAQELRQFTALLGINQGMKSGIEESIAFKHVFKNLYNEQFAKLPKVKVNENIANRTDLVAAICKLHGCDQTPELTEYYNNKINKVSNFLQKYGLDLYNLKIDMDKYFNDPEYRQGIVDCYDIIKGTINIFDIINKLPHFYEMLRAFNTTLQRVQVGSKSRFVLSQSEEYFHPENIANRDEYGNKMYNLDYNLSSYVIRRLQRFYDDYVISDFLLEKIAPILKISYTKNPTRENIVQYSVDITNKDGLNQFKQLVFDVIAKLRAMNPDNEFLRQLTPVNINKHSELATDYRYQLNFNLDSLSQKASEADILKYNQVVGGFNKIMNISLESLLDSYQNDSEYPLTVGDILFLYNTIFNLDAAGQNSLSSLFGRYISESKETSIPTMKYQIEQEYDQRKRELVPDEKLLNYYIFRPRIPARLNGVMEYRGERIQNNSPLINLQTVQDTKHVLEAFERFTEALRQNILTINLGEC